MHPKIMVMVMVKIMVTPQLWAPREGGFGGLHPLAVPAVGLHSLGELAHHWDEPQCRTSW